MGALEERMDEQDILKQNEQLRKENAALKAGGPAATPGAQDSSLAAEVERLKTDNARLRTALNMKSLTPTQRCLVANGHSPHSRVVISSNGEAGQE